MIKAILSFGMAMMLFGCMYPAEVEVHEHGAAPAKTTDNTTSVHEKTSTTSDPSGTSTHYEKQESVTKEVR